MLHGIKAQNVETSYLFYMHTSGDFCFFSLLIAYLKSKSSFKKFESNCDSYERSIFGKRLKWCKHEVTAHRKQTAQSLVSSLCQWLIIIYFLLKCTAFKWLTKKVTHKYRTVAQLISIVRISLLHPTAILYRYKGYKISYTNRHQYNFLFIHAICFVY